MIKKINIIRGILIILLLIIFSTIFGFSNQNREKSSSLSRRVTEAIVEINPLTNKLSIEEKEKVVEDMHTVIRKLAHFFVYMVVGILLMLLCKTYEMKEIKRWIISIIVGGTYAMTDEFHQLFIQGRSGQFSDVILDTSGVFVGALIIYLIAKIAEKHKKSFTL